MEQIRRHSEKRDRIYTYLKESHIHPTAEMIYQDLRVQIPNLSLGTVYRNLKQLEESGLVRRVASLQDAERYDAITAEHAHFLCRKCGLLIDLDQPEAQSLCKDLMLPLNYTAESFSLTITGLCASCASHS